MVLSGSGQIRVGDETVELRQWDAMRVAPEVVRAIVAGSEGLDVLAIGSDRPEGGDSTQAHGFWE